MSKDSSAYTPIAKLFDKGKKIVVLTGAGISAESGIPTFRDGAGGLWNQYNPAELASRQGFLKDPQLVYDWYQWRRSLVLKAEPNPGHQAIAAWEELFPHFHLITQNVDGLHRRAGSRRITEMHGSIHRMKCFGCSYKGEWRSESAIPLCEVCGDKLRPDIVWFGETIDRDDLTTIDKVLSDVDIFLAIGTSGTVYPAAGFLEQAKHQGATTIVINPDPGSGRGAHYALEEKASSALSSLTRLLKS